MTTETTNNGKTNLYEGKQKILKIWTKNKMMALSNSHPKSLFDGPDLKL